MKAAQLTHYAKDYQLEIRTIDRPQIKADEVLIEVREAAVNPLDALLGTGSLRLIQSIAPPHHGE